MQLKATTFDTPLGPICAIGNDEALVYLNFIDQSKFQKDEKKLTQQAIITPGNSKSTESIKYELEEYFTGQRQSFETPIFQQGSPFQKKVWQALMTVPFGSTRSYRNQAEIIGNRKAYRAVANANGANQFVIIVPCHRIINESGQLGGYSAGLERKQWLLTHEQRIKQNEPANTY